MTGAAILAALAFLWMQLADTPAAARMFPRSIIGVMALLTCVMMVRSYAGRTAPAAGVEEWRFFKHAGRFGISVGLFLVYLLGVSNIGYFASSAVFLMVLPLVFGFDRPGMLGVTMLAFLTFIWVIFVMIFGRTLPAELLFPALGG